MLLVFPCRRRRRHRAGRAHRSRADLPLPALRVARRAGAADHHRGAQESLADHPQAFDAHRRRAGTVTAAADAEAPNAAAVYSRGSSEGGYDASDTGWNPPLAAPAPDPARVAVRGPDRRGASDRDPRRGRRAERRQARRLPRCGAGGTATPSAVVQTGRRRRRDPAAGRGLAAAQRPGHAGPETLRPQLRELPPLRRPRRAWTAR